MSVDPLARSFDGAADEYDRGRPSWPPDAIAGLLDRFGATHVLDLAAGTGKLTRVLAAHAAEVIAVEPVDGMRRKLQERLPGVRALAGTAEAIPLPDGSVDAVFAAEAFHWFDYPRALGEIARVLRPGGHLAVMWNVAGDEGTPWFDELVGVVLDHRLEGSGAKRRETVPWRESLEADARFGPLRDEEAVHRQHTDRDGVVAMIASFSSIAALPEDRRARALEAAREVLERHGLDAIAVTYRALMTTTQVKRSGS